MTQIKFRPQSQQLLMMVSLIAATVGLRLYFQDIPNFAPVAAVALFAGFYFRSRWTAISVPVISMMITDQVIGGYQPLLMVTVYCLLALPVALRSRLRRQFDLERSSALSATSGLLGCTLAASVLFFVVTNFATWMVTPWYPRTLTGLSQCYVNALPFFRYTLAGDMIFGFTLFSAYALAYRLAGRAKPVALEQSRA